MQVALDLFEATWSELIGQPSSVSAEKAEQVHSLSICLQPNVSQTHRLCTALEPSFQILLCESKEGVSRVIASRG